MRRYAVIFTMAVLTTACQSFAEVVKMICALEEYKPVSRNFGKLSASVVHTEQFNDLGAERSGR